MPKGLQDEDTDVGMGFSILVTVFTLAGLLFCFRRASKLLPRNFNIQLQMFGQNDGGNTPGRGPIALSDDDLAGATGLEWEDLEAQLHDDEYDINEEEDAPDEELQDMASRPLRPMKRPERYLDNDDDDHGDEERAEEEDQGQELSSFTGGASRYRDDDEDNDDDDAVDAQGKGVLSKGPKDSPFQLDDGDSEQEA